MADAWDLQSGGGGALDHRRIRCIVKRRGTTDPGDAYVVMPLSVFSEWVRDD